MATIDATVAGASSNSYVTLAEFTTYVEEVPSPSSTVTGASDDTKTRALIFATRVLDRLRYLGLKSGGTQALQWPRYGVPDPDWPWQGTTTSAIAGAVDSTIIPTRVKRAQMRLAYLTLTGDFGVTESGLDGFEQVKVGPIEVKPRVINRSDELPDDVKREIRGFLDEMDGTVRLLRG